MSLVSLNNQITDDEDQLVGQEEDKTKTPPKRGKDPPLPVLTFQLLPTVTGLNALVSDKLELLEVFCMIETGGRDQEGTSGKWFATEQWKLRKCASVVLGGKISNCITKWFVKAQENSGVFLTWRVLPIKPKHWILLNSNDSIWGWGERYKSDINCYVI